MIAAEDIRMVELHKGRSLHTETYFIHKDDVNVFIQAQENLHDKPGINPYTRGKTSPLTYLKVSCLQPTNDFATWWTDPSLNGTNGAIILGWRTVTEKHYEHNLRALYATDVEEEQEERERRQLAQHDYEFAMYAEGHSE